MSIEPEAIAAPRVRRLTRWSVPFHLVVPVATGALGLLLLAGGGVVAVLGGWWLAVALPIALGAFVRDPRFALVPAACWAAWLVIAAIAGSDSGVAHTPVGIAIALAVVGGVATLVAQIAIFPATARDAWEPAVHRVRHAGEDTASAHDEKQADDEPAPPTVASLIADNPEMTRAMDAIVPISTSEQDALDDEPVGPDETAAATLAEPPRAAEVKRAVEEAGDVDALEAVGEGDVPEPEPAAEPPNAPSDVDAAERPPIDQAPKAQVEVELRGLPLDADPAPLDEGGHVTEFRAITEADILAAEQTSETSPADEGSKTGEAAGDQPGSDVP